MSASIPHQGGTHGLMGDGANKVRNQWTRWSPGCSRSLLRSVFRTFIHRLAMVATQFTNRLQSLIQINLQNLRKFSKLSLIVVCLASPVLGLAGCNDDEPNNVIQPADDAQAMAEDELQATSEKGE